MAEPPPLRHASAGAANQVVAACLTGQVPAPDRISPDERDEDVRGRAALFRCSRLDERERSELLDIFLARCQWTRIYFGWRPNWRDEGDNHLIELAVAGGAAAIVTRNTRDLLANQLKFPDLRIVTPEALLREETP